MAERPKLSLRKKSQAPEKDRQRPDEDAAQLAERLKRENWVDATAED